MDIYSVKNINETQLLLFICLLLSASFQAPPAQKPTKQQLGNTETDCINYVYLDFGDKKK